MKLNEISVVTASKRAALLEKMQRLKIDAGDIEESFVKGSGKGGQKKNKTANAVQLIYKPLNIVVRAQRERERSVNRFIALRELIEEIEFRISPETSERTKEWERLRRRKNRSRNGKMSKQSLLNVSHYHVHIYFDEKTRASASTLREDLRKTFAGRVRVHDLIDEPIGPHPLPMFEVDVPAPNMETVHAWLKAHHGAHSILIHPLTGDDLADHRDYPQWVGEPLKLDLEFLSRMRR